VHTLLLVTIWQFAIPPQGSFRCWQNAILLFVVPTETNWLEALKQPLDPTELVPKVEVLEGPSSKFVGTIKTLAAWSKSMES
jgi:hypothetical protein